MFKILFATDGSEAATEAQKLLDLLPLEGRAEVRLVTVVPAADSTFQQGRRAYELADSAHRSWAEWVQEETSRLFAARGVAVSAEPRAGNADHEIIEAARQWEADLAVIGAHGLTGLKAFLLGSVARNVAHHAGCSVLVARAPRNELRHVVLGADGSEAAQKAGKLLQRIPLPAETMITALSAARPYQVAPTVLAMDPPAFDSSGDELREQLAEECRRVAAAAAAELQAAGRRTEAEGRLGDPAGEILSLARERQSDLVALGARGVSAIESLVLGSVADRVLQGAECSVLIAR